MNAKIDNTANTSENNLISVIIPVYNSEKYFEKCVRSVIEQTYKNIEIIIINDCSTDGVENIIQKYKNIDYRIKYYKNKKNIGSGFTRNLGLSYSTGKFIYFLDSDDYIEKNCLEVLRGKIKEEDSFSCMLEGYKEINNKRTKVSRTKEELELLYSPSLAIRLFNKKVISNSNIIFSNLKVGEDLEFIFKILMFNDKVSYVDKPLYTYVVHSDSLLRTRASDQLDIISAIKSIEYFAKKSNVYKEYKEKIEFVAVNHVLVGAIKRIKSNENYRLDDIKKCMDFVNENFSSWKENSYVKEMLSTRGNVFGELKNF